MYSLQLILLLMQVLYIRGVLSRRQRRLLAYRRQRFLRGALLYSILLGFNICEVFEESHDERWNTEDEDDGPEPNTSTEDEVDSSGP